MNKEYNSCVEGCSLPSSPNDLKVVVMQLRREVENLTKTTEAKLLCHDGKIAELTKYIKDNLSNSIRCLLDSMMVSGELDKIITDTISREIFELKNLVVNVQDYGAIGDGINDDTLAFKKAIAKCDGKELYIPKTNNVYKVRDVKLKTYLKLK